MHEGTELAGVQGTAGISRRDMLRKSAIVGGAGALMWAAPSITKFSGAAAWGTEVGKGLSYIALEYDCDGVKYIKFDLDELDENGDPDYSWETGDNFKTPGCETEFPRDRTSEGTYAGNEGDLFGVSYDIVDDDGEPLQVTITLPPNCSWANGAGFGKCGNPDVEASGGECAPPSNQTDYSVTFVCGVE